MSRIYPYLIVTILSIYVYACANQGTPTGGPKDTIPPTLIESYPITQTLNYKNKEFTLVFDERITADKLKSKLIITPYIENDFKIKSTKYSVKLIFENNFEDSTTYTLNFSDGITDVTEKNPAENLRIAFSTGPYIDSISVKGQIRNLYTNEKIEKALVSLYHIDDTVDVMTGKPRYFAQTDTSGSYFIENIKNGYYKIYAFEDANNNLMLDSDEEAHGFIADSIDLYSNKENLDIKIQLLNVDEFKFVRAKKTGRYFDAIYNKNVDSIKVIKADSTSHLPLPIHNLIKDDLTLRFYYDSTFNYDTDSLQIILQAYDSVHNYTEDTTFIKFSESKRKPESFSSTYTPRSKSNITSTHNVQFRFTKPISTFNIDSSSIQFDTLINQKIPDSIIIWNDNKTKMSFTNTLNTQYFNKYRDSVLYTIKDTTVKIQEQQFIDEDTSTFTLDSLDMIETDSLLPLDSLTIMKMDSTAKADSIKNAQIKYLENINTNMIAYLFKKGTFVSLENDTVETEIIYYKFKQGENFGKINGNINTTHQSYFLQLVNTKYEVVTQIYNPGESYTFDLVEPGTYSIRVLIDSNLDGVWSPGNIAQNREPEEVYFFGEEFEVRANWELENINIQFEAVDNSLKSLE